MTPLTEIARLFADSLAATPKPEAPMPYVTIPAETPPERDPGVVDVTPETWPENVADFREGVDRRKRDRNATPRTVFTDGDAA